MKTMLLISDSYPPVINSASHLMYELANGLRARGYDVVVATSYPKHYLSSGDQSKKFDEFAIEESIKIIRIKTLPLHKVNFIVRGIAQITLPYLFTSKIKHYLYRLHGSKGNVDVVVVYSPPLPLAIVGAKVKKFFGAKFLLNVQDLFPQNAVDLGILRNAILIKFFEMIERNAYENADVVTFHSEGNLRFVSNKHASLMNRFRVLHNWIDVDEFDGFTTTGLFRQKFGLKNKFIMLYAGVMGPSQGLDFVIELAKKVKDLEEMCFLLVGDGIQKDDLERRAKEFRLDNVLFKSFISKAEYPLLVKDCDVGLVSLTSKNKTPVVPGKILGYMAAGIPVLAFLNKESDGHLMIKQARCGYSSLWGDLKEGEALIRKIYAERDRLLELGRSGYYYVKENFNKDKIINELLQIINFDGQCSL
ncbi:MAG TPA: glycosyltransferase family 4 protein [Syntrophorhabdaceae bacterium]|nr:glycosyltransferase family 4 protein [Syntrophorhabdaceae bacterium]